MDARVEWMQSDGWDYWYQSPAWSNHTKCVVLEFRRRCRTIRSMRSRSTRPRSWCSRIETDTSVESFVSDTVIQDTIPARWLKSGPRKRWETCSVCRLRFDNNQSATHHIIDLISLIGPTITDSITASITRVGDDVLGKGWMASTKGIRYLTTVCTR